MCCPAGWRQLPYVRPVGWEAGRLSWECWPGGDICGGLSVCGTTYRVSHPLSSCHSHYAEWSLAATRRMKRALGLAQPFPSSWRRQTDLRGPCSGILRRKQTQTAPSADNLSYKCKESRHCLLCTGSEACRKWIHKTDTVFFGKQSYKGAEGRHL